MKATLKLEEFFLFGLSLLLFARLEYAWWLYPALLLVPDLSMLGYLGGARLGAVVYNVVHHRALAVALYLAGFWLGSSHLQLAGVILLGHSSLDRVFGYGLKYPDAFQHTHLGLIGSRAETVEAAWKSD
jgi:hypothetical protein